MSKKKSKGKGARKGAPKPRKRAKAAPVRYILQTERVVTPKGESKADKYRYPKGHPKAGQYAPKAEAEKAATRYVKRRGGKREVIAPEGKGRAKKGRTADIGRSFTEQAAAHTAVDAVHEAAAKGRTIFVKLGGNVYEVPEGRRKDAEAFMVDLRAKFLSATRRNAAGRGYPFSVELSYGARGVLVGLDRLDFFNPELREALGDIADYTDLAEELARYMARSAGEYLGIRTNAKDILDAWDSEGTTEEQNDEE